MLTYRKRLMICTTILCIFVLFLGGCGREDGPSGEDMGVQTEAYFEGLIYEVSTTNDDVSSILVIADLDDIHLSEEEWYGKEAIVFSINAEVKLLDKNGKPLSKKELKPGLGVRVHHSGELRESYPMQGDAFSVQVLDDFLDESVKVEAENQEGDFILQLTTEKKAFKSTEDVVLQAQLKYIGAKPEEVIYHAASPFYFNITEKNRNVTIPYAMNEPLISTSLKQGEWYIEEYTKTGGYSEGDSDASFIKEFLQGKNFPEGEYTIELKAVFFTEAAEERQEYALAVSLDITID